MHSKIQLLLLPYFVCSAPRQGMPQVPFLTADDNQRQLTFQTKNKWLKAGYKPITWRIRNHQKGAKYSAEKLEHEVERAFNLWSDCIEIDFKKVHGWADIEISFKADDHWPCRFTFHSDIPDEVEEKLNGTVTGTVSDVIAHALPPPDMSYTDELDGDIHISENQEFVLAKPEKEKQHDLFLVLLHEIGHSLGLDHNFEHEDSIMQPAIDRNWNRKMRSLPAPDVAALRRIYPNARFCKVDERGVKGFFETSSSTRLASAAVFSLLVLLL